MISPSPLHQISISTTPRTRKLKRKRKNSRETCKDGVLTVNLIDSCLDVLERRRTCPFIGRKFITVRSKRSTVTITVHDGPFSENVAIVGSRMEGPYLSRDVRYKNAPFSPLGSRSDGLDALRQIASRPL